MGERNKPMDENQKRSLQEIVDNFNTKIYSKRIDGEMKLRKLMNQDGDLKVPKAQ